MSGWIRLWRQLRDHPFWRQRRRFSKAEAWLDVLMDAAFEDQEVLFGNRVVHVKRGQALFSARKKAAKWLWSRNCVHAFFLLLERERMVSREVSHGPDGGYTLVTILNYSKYQDSADVGDHQEVSHDSSHEVSHGRATVGPRLEPLEEDKEVQEGKKSSLPASGPTLATYLEKLPPEGQEVLRQVVSAIATTRKTGKVAQSVLDSLAREWSRFASEIVLKACRVYVDRRYAEEGKGEKYLLGIIRQEVKRSGNGREPSSSLVGQKGKAPTPIAPAGAEPGLPYPRPTTEGQRAINRAWREQQVEREQGQ